MLKVSLFKVERLKFQILESVTQFFMGTRYIYTYIVKHIPANSNMKLVLSLLFIGWRMQHFSDCWFYSIQQR